MPADIRDDCVGRRRISVVGGVVIDGVFPELGTMGVIVLDHPPHPGHATVLGGALVDVSAFHCAMSVIFCAGIVLGSTGDQPEKVYPVRVGETGGVTLLP